MHPKKEMNLLENINHLCQQITFVFENEIKDKINLQILEKFKKVDLSEGKQTFIFICILSRGQKTIFF